MGWGGEPSLDHVWLNEEMFSQVENRSPKLMNCGK